eukprot:COSAG01_NODE_39390_length_477_cov_0.791005_1_plen_158_part_11
MQVVQKLREAAKHAPLRCSKSDHGHDVHGRSARDLNAAAAAEAFALAGAGRGSAGRGSSPSKDHAADLISTVRSRSSPGPGGGGESSDGGSGSEGFDAVSGRHTALGNNQTGGGGGGGGVKIAVGFEPPPIATLEMFDAVPLTAEGSAGKDAPKAMRL